MLKIIKPKEQYFYQARIGLLLNMMRTFQGIPLREEEQKIATFIIGEADHQDASFLEAGDVYGGALLYQRSIQDLPPAFQQAIATSTTQSPGEKTIWGSVVSLFINPKQPPLKEDEPDGFQIFYKELLDKFIEFAHQSNINFLYLTLCPFEYQHTKTKGLWPYAFEISPEDSPDGLFHGILSLPTNKKKSKKQRPPKQASLLNSSLAA